jgi:DNA invertase Pin-like site-specific DNA recombinase
VDAIAYLRVSTREQADTGVGLDAQRRAVEAYAAFRGLNITRWIVDAGVSASKPLHTRDGGAELLAAVDAGEAAAVVAMKLDRLFRNAADTLNVTQAWDAAGVGLHLLDLNINTSSVTGRAFLTMAAAFAELELARCRERTRDALAVVKADGGRIGAEGYGWTREEDRDAAGRRVVSDVEREARAVELMRELRASGATFRRIAEELNGRAVPTKRGGAWHANTVRRILNRAA